MHAANLFSSIRLQRVLKVLGDGKEHSTRNLIRKSGHCAINSIVSELRLNGVPVDCTRRKNIWYYKLGTNH